MPKTDASWNERKEQPTTITEYDEQLVRRLIEKVTVFKDKFTAEFKSIG